MTINYATANCTCGCPDGEGQHLCGCHVYDSQFMRMYREQYGNLQVKIRRQLKKLTGGELPPHRHERFAAELTSNIRELCRVVGRMAVEDHRNENGRHDDEPWK